MNNDMENYQLYRTNVALSGQMKWDLIIDSFNDELYVKNFNITPISQRVPFNKHVKNNLTNYTHQENVVSFYKNIQSSFYNPYIDPKFDNPWPIISDKKIDPHDSQYEMGCRRGQYELYNEQFEFFCPLWLEQVSLDDSGAEIEFEIKISTNLNSTPISTKRLKLNNINYTKEVEYHNKFVNYLKNYLIYTKISEGNDNVISIHLNKNSAQISGLNASNGLNSVLELPTLVQNLLSRERPMLEFDNMIIQNFENKTMVAHQLFNFNLCFNIDDLLNQFMRKSLIGSNIYIEVNAIVNGEYLSKVDFYSNYDYIPKKLCGYDIELNPLNTVRPKSKHTEHPNVFNYMSDNQFIDLISKNKIVQNTIHWSLVGNNDYIFNLYDGFAGYIIKEDGSTSALTHLYGDSPDLTTNKYSDTLNSLNWCTSILLNVNPEEEYLIESMWDFLRKHQLDYLTSISPDTIWLNNVKYDVISSDIKSLKITTIIDNDKMLLKHFDAQLNNDNIDVWSYDYDIYKNDDIAMCMGENYIIFVSHEKNKLIFNSIKSFLNNANIQTKWKSNVEFLRDKMNHTDKNLSVITPQTTLKMCITKGPALSITEIDYYKNDLQKGPYMIRYSGKIKPTFISAKDERFNYIYSKDIITDWKNSKYVKYEQTGYAPLYPSIDYFSLKSDKISYIIETSKDEEIVKKFINNSYEYKWFDKNCLYYLKPVLSTDIESNDESLSVLVKEFVRQTYDIKNDDLLDYIFNLYDITYNFEYADKHNINKFIYSVKLTLK